MTLEELADKIVDKLIEEKTAKQTGPDTFEIASMNAVLKRVKEMINPSTQTRN